MSSIRTLLPFTLLTLFCLYYFSSSIHNASHDLWDWLAVTAKPPDFSHYAPSPHTLSAREFPIDHPHKRVLVVGDIHGMHDPLQALLDKLDYNPASDVLVHVGDIVAKGPHHGSLAILDFMSRNNVTGVRGNHDQMVVEWRAWLNWITALDGGAVWLNNLHAAEEEADPDDPEKWAEKYLKRHTKRKWRTRIPKGWSMLSDHYRIARDMTPSHFAYMLSLPLVLHAPEAHVLIAHAGILPSDPRYKPSHRRQPLARVPSLPSNLGHGDDKTATLRRLQEEAILFNVPQNTDAWVTLNMRGIRSDNSVTRKKDGTPWADIWNRDMGYCAGFDARNRYQPRATSPELPCFPATVVYGHAAARGLDVKRWSVGLDSACVKGERMSALVLDATARTREQEVMGEVLKKKTIPFGERSAHIVDVKCS